VDVAVKKTTRDRNKQISLARIGIGSVEAWKSVLRRFQKASTRWTDKIPSPTRQKSQARNAQAIRRVPPWHQPTELDSAHAATHLKIRATAEHLLQNEAQTMLAQWSKQKTDCFCLL
jgi:hypothetical protein